MSTWSTSQGRPRSSSKCVNSRCWCNARTDIYTHICTCTSLLAPAPSLDSQLPKQRTLNLGPTLLIPADVVARSDYGTCSLESKKARNWLHVCFYSSVINTSPAEGDTLTTFAAGATATEKEATAGSSMRTAVGAGGGAVECC